jgi:hypothetical protein
MPAGCDFVCKNEDCDYFDTGFTITGPWPMGDIDEIIETDRVKAIPQLQAQMKHMKESGREYACITFPNDDNIEAICYRVQLWSVEGNCIWDYDVFVEGEDNLEETIKKSGLPDKCPNTGSEMISFKQTTKDGIDCPSCSKKLNQKRWFTNED